MTEVFRRNRALGESEKLQEDGHIRLIASTQDPVSWGDWREVLVHADGCVDMSAARSLLINHDADQLAGGIAGMRFEDGSLLSEADVDEDVRLRSGMSARKAVKKRYLGGVSIGYTYDLADTIWDAETRTLTVNRWRLLEISLTPIPADKRAQVRSLPFKSEIAISGYCQPVGAQVAGTGSTQSITTVTTTSGASILGLDAIRTAINQNLVSVSNPTAASPAAPITTEHRMSDHKDDPKPQGQETAANHNEISEKARAGAIAESREIAALAREHKLDADKYIGMPKAEATNEMLRDLASRNATEVRQGVAMIHVDQADKARDAFCGSLAYRAGMRTGEFAEMQKGNPLIGQGIQHSIRKYARLMGLNTEDWSNRDAAFFALGKPMMMDQVHQRAANVTSSNFPSFVFLNAITKIIAKGFEQGSSTSRYQRLVEQQVVPDFKQFSIGALSAGNLVKTAENAAFPELDKAEGVYNSTVKMWGGTLSYSMQAIVNDDTGSLDRLVRLAGSIADKTIDRRVFQKLLMGTSSDEATSTWTSNTTSGGSLVYTTADLGAAARGKLALVRAALANKVGLDGNPLGTIPRFLICGPTREVEAQAIVGGSGPLLTAGQPQNAVSLEVVSSPWMEASALTGYSTTSYYLLADPMDATGLVLTKIRGFETIQVMPYDAGAVAALNVKLWFPFEADLAYLSVGGTNTIAAAQQGTT